MWNALTWQVLIFSKNQGVTSLDSDDLPCHHAPPPLCQCGFPARQGWCPQSLAIATSVVTLLVRTMHEWVHIEKFFISHCICHKWIVTCLCQQHTRHCDWEYFDGREEFLDEVQRKGAKLGKRIVYEKKMEMCENIWRSHRVGFLGQLRESWTCFSYVTMKWQTTCMISTIQPCRTRDRTARSILLCMFGTHFILIC
jgi:hypothetical protein